MVILMTKPVSLKSKALDYLARRDYSYRELFQKLLKYTPDQAEIIAVLDEMVAKKFLNEERYIENFIHSKSHKYGSRKINYLLQEKCQDRELIAQIYRAQEIDELAVARQIRERRFGEELPTTPAEKNRQFRFLLNRGFSPEIISKLLNERSYDQ